MLIAECRMLIAVLSAANPGTPEKFLIHVTSITDLSPDSVEDMARSAPNCVTGVSYTDYPQPRGRVHFLVQRFAFTERLHPRENETESNMPAAPLKVLIVDGRESSDRTRAPP